MQKLEERVSAFKKRQYKAKDQQKWSRILTTDFMSSEESGSEDGEEINIVMDGILHLWMNFFSHLIAS